MADQTTKPLAVVTGASTGIGYELAEECARNGFDLIVAADEPRIEEAAERLRQIGAAVDAVEADLATTEGVDRLYAAIAGRPVDALLANAGRGLGKGFLDQDFGDIRHVIDTNVTALVTLTHRLLPQLVERRGAIINISSVAGVYPYPGGNTYGGTKAFVSQFSLGLRSDLHGTGVRVTTIEPGMAETEFTVVRTHGDQNASDKLYSGANPMTAEDIAEQIFWVASLPPHLNINRLELMPVSQSFAGFQVAREG